MQESRSVFRPLSTSDFHEQLRISESFYSVNFALGLLLVPLAARWHCHWPSGRPSSQRGAFPDEKRDVYVRDALHTS